MEEKLGWFPHSAFVTWSTAFEDKYQMVDMIMVGDRSFSKNKTRKKEGRHCIFCNKSHPETKFETAAHLISRMIGNTDLFSTFECDKCNNLFSKLETDVASFLGVGRSITSMNEERKAPGYLGIDINAKSITFKNKKLLVIHKENAERNAEEGTTKIKYQKASYTPANVYKLFLKCALSILPNDEVINDFQFALKHLQGGTVLGGAHINIFSFPLTVNMPLHVYLFRKKLATEKLPFYVASFYFYNFVINVPILLHREDVQNLNQLIKIPVAPPYFVHGCDLDVIVPTFTTYELSSPVKLKHEPEELTMQFDKADLEKAVKFNPLTGEETQGAYNPVGSKYFIQTEDGAEFTKAELSELVKLIKKEFGEDN